MPTKFVETRFCMPANFQSPFDQSSNESEEDQHTQMSSTQVSPTQVSPTQASSTRPPPPSYPPPMPPTRLTRRASSRRVIIDLSKEVGPQAKATELSKKVNRMGILILVCVCVRNLAAVTFVIASVGTVLKFIFKGRVIEELSEMAFVVDAVCAVVSMCLQYLIRLSRKYLIKLQSNLRSAQAKSYGTIL